MTRYECWSLLLGAGTVEYDLGYLAALHPRPVGGLCAALELECDGLALADHHLAQPLLSEVGQLRPVKHSRSGVRLVGLQIHRSKASKQLQCGQPVNLNSIFGSSPQFGPDARRRRGKCCWSRPSKTSEWRPPNSCSCASARSARCSLPTRYSSRTSRTRL